MAEIPPEVPAGLVSGLSTFFDSNAIWFVPIAIVGYQFMLKIAVGDVPSREQWQAVLQLPTDLCILAITFLASIILVEPHKSAGVAGALFVCMIATTLSFHIVKRSPLDFSSRSVRKSVLMLLLNLIIASILLIYSAQKLLGV
ncbi:hypothetical protein [Vibrio lentus]|uniref:Uncharacterized protein n=1 Tax=Vibrio lentus TaxID=136468 RepID=A0A855IL61_9VIBR|nr:hypothetical protein [Vibrio lentus]PMM54455.1 hypothetical protein BCT50_12300 [Vibrio lentus]